MSNNEVKTRTVAGMELACNKLSIKADIDTDPVFCSA